MGGLAPEGVAADTLLPTEDGLVRSAWLARDRTLSEAARLVASLDGRQKIDTVDSLGGRASREVVLRNGMRLIGTPGHPVLVAGHNRLDWRRLDELIVGDAVATQLGSCMWSATPERFDDFVPTKSYGSQKRVRIPAEMTEELAFLLGAYAAEGHTSRSNWTITVTNACDPVLDRVRAAWDSELGVTAKIVRDPGKCPGVVVASKTIVEFLAYLGAGSRASDKRIPDAVLRSPRPMVLSFLRGLSLDAYVTVSTAPKWAICLDAPDLLDDLQAVVANLGIMSGRVAKYNKDYDKDFGEVYVTGEYAQRLATLVPFTEPDKASRANELCNRAFEVAHATADVVPGIAGRSLFELLPRTSRHEFHFLCDRRTKCITRRSLERVAAVPGIVLPPWLRAVLADGLYFSPVSSVADVGATHICALRLRETNAFVGNGIVSRGAAGG